MQAWSKAVAPDPSGASRFAPAFTSKRAAPSLPHITARCRAVELRESVASTLAPSWISWQGTKHKEREGMRARTHHCSANKIVMPLQRSSTERFSTLVNRERVARKAEHLSCSCLFIPVLYRFFDGTPSPTEIPPSFGGLTSRFSSFSTWVTRHIVILRVASANNDLHSSNKTHEHG